MNRSRAAVATVVAPIALGAGMLGLALSRMPHAPGGDRGPVAASGLTLASLAVDGNSRLVVTSLRTGGAAADAGLKVGDAIEGVAGRARPSLRTVSDAIGGGDGRIVDLRVRRAGGLLTVRMRDPGPGTGKRTR